MGKVSLHSSLTRTVFIYICWPSKITENVPIHSCGGYENILFRSSTAESVIDQWVHHFCLHFTGHDSIGRDPGKCSLFMWWGGRERGYWWTNSLQSVVGVCVLQSVVLLLCFLCLATYSGIITRKIKTYLFYGHTCRVQEV